jgi:hypothetical protein
MSEALSQGCALRCQPNIKERLLISKIRKKLDTAEEKPGRSAKYVSRHGDECVSRDKLWPVFYADQVLDFGLNTLGNEANIVLYQLEPPASVAQRWVRGEVIEHGFCGPAMALR